MAREVREPAEIEIVYRSLLVPSFPSDELVRIESLQSGVASGRMSIIVPADGELSAVAIAENDPPSPIVLLSYLTTHPATRSRGVGGALLTAAIDVWRTRWEPHLMIAEIETAEEGPAEAADVSAHGDPARRERFYGRRGSLILDVPYFQPALFVGTERVLAMRLIALEVDPDWLSDDGTRLEVTTPLVTFLASYTDDGTPTPDERRERLLNAASSPDGIGLLPMRK